MLRLFFILFLFISTCIHSSSIKDGFEALSIYDYFKAKKIFLEQLNKKPSESSFGLAIIFFRTDNPFSNIDSSAKYISKSLRYQKDSSNYFGFKINKESIKHLAQQIGVKGYHKLIDSTNAQNINHFLTHYYFADSSLKNKAINIRDEIRLNDYASSKKSDSILMFMRKYPESTLYTLAQKLFYDFQYKEQVKNNTIIELKQFLIRYPGNPNCINAEVSLLNLIKQEHSPELLSNYISESATSQTTEEAWKYLYGLEVKNYDKNTLLNFTKKYPNYPYINLIFKEIELSEIKLIAIKSANDFYGFIDTTGNWIIKPIFDDAQNFTEGFAAVCKNDSCFFINKNGDKINSEIYEDVESFYNGIAIVKKQNLSYLLNRSGQIISDGYEEVNTSSNNLYVCRKNNLYGAIDSKANIIIPFVYTKLGDFKNGYSYYQKEKIGLINNKNQILPDVWEWISEVNDNKQILVKQNQKFGLMHVSGELLIDANYDLITECAENIFMLVTNNLYGFYNTKDRCFISNIEFTYKSMLKPEDYFNGNFFKLYKDNDVAIMDTNGKLLVNFGVYQNIQFNEENILKVQKNNKYGFLDIKLKSIIPIEFEHAENFSNNNCIVAKSNTYYIINKQGKINFSLKNGHLKRLTNSMIYMENNDKIGFINFKGEVILPIIYDAYKNYDEDSYILEKEDKTFYYHPKYNILIGLN
jgi:hypothetical protein